MGFAWAILDATDACNSHARVYRGLQQVGVKLQELNHRLFLLFLTSTLPESKKKMLLPPRIVERISTALMWDLNSSQLPSQSRNVSIISPQNVSCFS